MAPREPTVDYYAILEVEQTDSLEIIKNSYRRLAVVLHPDKNPSKSNATAEFQLVGYRKTMTVHVADFRIVADCEPQATGSIRNAE